MLRVAETFPTCLVPIRINNREDVSMFQSVLKISKACFNMFLIESLILFFGFDCFWLAFYASDMANDVTRL